MENIGPKSNQTTETFSKISIKYGEPINFNEVEKYL